MFWGYHHLRKPPYWSQTTKKPSSIHHARALNALCPPRPPKYHLPVEMHLLHLTKTTIESIDDFFRPAFFSNKKVCPSDMYHLCICLLCFFNSIHFYECMHPQGHCLLYLFLFLPWLMEHTQNVGGNIIYNP